MDIDLISCGPQANIYPAYIPDITFREPHRGIRPRHPTVP